MRRFAKMINLVWALSIFLTFFFAVWLSVIYAIHKAIAGRTIINPSHLFGGSVILTIVTVVPIHILLRGKSDPGGQSSHAHRNESETDESEK